MGGKADTVINDVRFSFSSSTGQQPIERTVTIGTIGSLKGPPVQEGAIGVRRSAGSHVQAARPRR